MNCHARKALALVGAALVICSAPTYALAAQGELGTCLSELLSGTLPEAMEKLHVPGVVISAVHNGSVAYTAGFGMADLASETPMDPSSTLMRAGSISKLLVATAVLQQVEAGRLSLDEAVNKYLEDFKLPDYGGEPITLKHLLTHTAGFDEDVVNLVAAPLSPLQPLEEYLRECMPRLIRQPGKVIQYSNYGMALAAHIVEEVTGFDFRTIADTEILGPMGMNDSTFRGPEQAGLPLSRSYHWVNGRYAVTPYQRILPYPAGSLLTTASDMAMFMIAMLPSGAANGVVTPQSIALMQSRQFTNHAGVLGMGLAWFEGQINGIPTVSHGGDIWSFSSTLVLAPEHDFGLFASGNGSGAAVLMNQIVKDVFDAVFPEPEGAADTAAPVFREETDATEFVGVYRLNRYPRHSVDKLMALSLEATIRANPDGGITFVPAAGSGNPPSSAIRTGDTIFQLEKGDEMLAFDRAHGSERMRMYIAQWAYEKLKWHETSSFWIPAFGISALIFAIASIAFLLNIVARLRKKRVRKALMLVASPVRGRKRLDPTPAGLMSILDLSVILCLFIALLGLRQWEALAHLPMAGKLLETAVILAQLPALVLTVQLISIPRRGFAEILAAAALAAHVVFTWGAAYWHIVNWPLWFLK